MRGDLQDDTQLGLVLSIPLCIEDPGELASYVVPDGTAVKVVSSPNLTVDLRELGYRSSVPKERLVDEETGEIIILVKATSSSKEKVLIGAQHSIKASSTLVSTSVPTVKERGLLANYSVAESLDVLKAKVGSVTVSDVGATEVSTVATGLVTTVGLDQKVQLTTSDTVKVGLPVSGV